MKICFAKYASGDLAGQIHSIYRLSRPQPNVYERSSTEVRTETWDQMSGPVFELTGNFVNAHCRDQITVDMGLRP